MGIKTISYSEVDTYRQCRLKWQLSYRELWGSTATAPALERGTLWHSVMEAHYGAIKKLREEKQPRPEAQDLFLAVAPLLYEEGTGRQTEDQALIEWMYRGYVDLYQTDGSWEIVAIEKPFEVWLPNERGNRTSFKLAGTADLIIRDHSAGGGLWIVDHKTCKDLPRQKDFDMEDQTGIYTYLMKKQLGWDVRGAIYNHCRTRQLVRPMTLDERFKRTHTVRLDSELRTMALELLDTMKEAYAKKIVGVDGEPIDLPRTPDGERCGWKCGYTEACLAGRKYGPKKTRTMLEDTGFTVMEHKPGPTFTRIAEEAEKADKPSRGKDADELDRVFT